MSFICSKPAQQPGKRGGQRHAGFTGEGFGQAIDDQLCIELVCGMLLGQLAKHVINPVVRNRPPAQQREQVLLFIHDMRTVIQPQKPQNRLHHVPVRPFLIGNPVENITQNPVAKMFGKNIVQRFSKLRWWRRVGERLQCQNLRLLLLRHFQFLL